MVRRPGGIGLQPRRVPAVDLREADVRIQRPFNERGCLTI